MHKWGLRALLQGVPIGPDINMGQMQVTMNILLVEEDNCVRHALTRFFETKGCRVIDASSSRDGLILLQNIKFQLVVAEFELSGLDGLSFLKQVCRLYPGIKMILFTSYAETEIRSRALSLALCRVLEKPLDIERLNTALSDFMKQS